MAKYVQRITIGDRERWLGWEVDGIGTEMPGLTLAERFSEEELSARGIRQFFPMSFDEFAGLSAMTSRRGTPLTDEDIAFRLDALRVTLDRFFARGHSEIPKLLLEQMLGEVPLADARIVTALRQWEKDGGISVLREEPCYLRVLRHLIA